MHLLCIRDIYPYQTFIRTTLRGGMSVLEIVFVGQCEAFVCIDFVGPFFFPLGCEAQRSAN